MELAHFQTEEEASKGIKEKMCTNATPSHGEDVHVTRDVVTEAGMMVVGQRVWGEAGQPSARGGLSSLASCCRVAWGRSTVASNHMDYCLVSQVKHQLSKADLCANLSQDVLEERTRIQFIRWRYSVSSH